MSTFLCVLLSPQRIDIIAALWIHLYSISVVLFQEPFLKGFSLFSIDFSFETSTKIILLVSVRGFTIFVLAKVNLLFCSQWTDLHVHCHDLTKVT